MGGDVDVVYRLGVIPLRVCREAKGVTVRLGRR